MQLNVWNDLAKAKICLSRRLRLPFCAPPNASAGLAKTTLVPAVPVSRGWNSWFPTWGVTVGSNCRFPDVQFAEFTNLHELSDFLEDKV